jgi:hypothetical protein
MVGDAAGDSARWRGLVGFEGAFFFSFDNKFALADPLTLSSSELLSKSAIIA